MKSTIISLAFASLASAAEPLVASLGSSYAAGPGLTRPIGQILADKLETTYGGTYNFSNIAVSGSVLSDVTKSQAPKLQGTKPSVIYLVSGGNDLNYVLCLANPDNSVCKNPISKAEYETRYETALDAIVKAIDYDTSVPIYVVEYIQAINDGSNCGSSNSACPLSTAQVSEVSGIYDEVTTGTEDALKTWKASASNSEYKVTFIPMRQYSAGHLVGSSVPWINGATIPTGAGGIAWHPNDAGAEAVAQYIYEDLVSNSDDGYVDC